MPYMIFKNVKTDKDFKTVFNGLVITLNYSNAGVTPTIDYIKSDLSNAVFIDCFMSNKEPLTVEFKNRLYNTVANLNARDYGTLTTVLYVLGLL